MLFRIKEQRTFPGNSPIEFQEIHAGDIALRWVIQGFTHDVNIMIIPTICPILSGPVEEWNMSPLMRRDVAPSRFEGLKG
jgi:hypothetical protein